MSTDPELIAYGDPDQGAFDYQVFETRPFREEGEFWTEPVSLAKWNGRKVPPEILDLPNLTLQDPYYLSCNGGIPREVPVVWHGSAAHQAADNPTAIIPALTLGAGLFLLGLDVGDHPAAARFRQTS